MGAGGGKNIWAETAKGLEMAGAHEPLSTAMWSVIDKPGPDSQGGLWRHGVRRVSCSSPIHWAETLQMPAPPGWGPSREPYIRDFARIS